MSLTKEQQLIVDKCVERFKSDELESYIQVNAIAGSGKSHTLRSIIDAVKHLKNNFTSRYFAYSKKLADEAQEKFEKQYTISSTIHSMAYQKVVRLLGLNVFHGNMKPNQLHDIPESAGLKHFNRKKFNEYRKKSLLYNLSVYFTSGFTSISEYITSLDQEERDLELEELMQYYFTLMARGKHECTHGFYLKLFHIMLHNDAFHKNYIEEFDVLLYDEVGDANQASLQIFKLLKAKLKVMVGDDLQNIFGFNNTVNGFKEMEGTGDLFTLSTSFRVSDVIASKIEPFCKTYCDPNMSFTGITYSRPENNSMAYLARTNSSLVGKMIDLDSKGTPYNITKSADEMFALPIALLTIKEHEPIRLKELMHIQRDVDDYFSSAYLKNEYDSIFGYIASKHSDDISIKTACALISKYKPTKIFETYKNAKNHAVGKKDHYITLSTLHSSKGLEYDVVHIMDDMNDRLTKIIMEIEELVYLTNQDAETEEEKITLIDAMTDSQRQEFLLYYVGVSRAKHKLINAKHLNSGKIIE